VSSSAASNASRASAAVSGGSLQVRGQLVVVPVLRWRPPLFGRKSCASWRRGKMTRRAGALVDDSTLRRFELVDLASAGAPLIALSPLVRRPAGRRLLLVSLGGGCGDRTNLGAQRVSRSSPAFSYAIRARRSTGRSSVLEALFGPSSHIATHAHCQTSAVDVKTTRQIGARHRPPRADVLCGITAPNSVSGFCRRKGAPVGMARPAGLPQGRLARTPDHYRDKWPAASSCQLDGSVSGLTSLIPRGRVSVRRCSTGVTNSGRNSSPAAAPVAGRSSRAANWSEPIRVSPSACEGLMSIDGRSPGFGQIRGLIRATGDSYRLVRWMSA